MEKATLSLYVQRGRKVKGSQKERKIYYKKVLGWCPFFFTEDIFSLKSAFLFLKIKAGFLCKNQPLEVCFSANDAPFANMYENMLLSAIQSVAAISLHELLCFCIAFC